jgi:hypothetical protein
LPVVYMRHVQKTKAAPRRLENRLISDLRLRLRRRRGGVSTRLEPGCTSKTKTPGSFFRLRWLCGWPLRARSGRRRDPPKAPAARSRPPVPVACPLSVDLQDGAGRVQAGGAPVVLNQRCATGLGQDGRGYSMRSTSREPVSWPLRIGG